MTTPTPMATEELPELPNAWDYAYEWDSPIGIRRSFDYRPHNGVKPDRHVSLFTEDQMHAYVLADRAARQEAVPADPELTSREVNDACWAWLEAMPRESDPEEAGYLKTPAIRAGTRVSRRQFTVNVTLVTEPLSVSRDQ